MDWIWICSLRIRTFRKLSCRRICNFPAFCKIYYLFHKALIRAYSEPVESNPHHHTLFCKAHLLYVSQSHVPSVLPNYWDIFFFLYPVFTTLMSFCRLLLEVPRKEAPQSVGLLWTSDQSVADTSTWQTHHTHNGQPSMPPAGFEPAIPASDRS